jgi:ABC-type transport system substrate-binding protein
VRRAANFILNRTAAARVGAGKASASPADHFFVPGLVDNLNADFRPYESTSTADALAKAQKEMKQSKYDPGKAGKCSAPECSDIRFIPLEVDDPANELLRQDFAQIGLGLKAESYSPETAFAKCSDPSEKVAICSGYTFGANSTDAESIAQYLYTSGIGPEGCCNAALLGATPKQLASFGYAGVTPPPDVEPGLRRCSTLSGKSRDQCYASEDRRISTEVVPFVYALFPNELEVVSSRVRNYTYDQFGYMSLNYAAIAP